MRALPLLTKELYEQAARWQTYAYRVAYALLLFVAALWFFRDILERQASSPLEVLGQGREMFLTIIRLQMVGVYLFMPALTCNAITIEKERNTLGTLLLTRLSPFEIILEKLLARMVPMVGFQLLSLPLLAYTYTLGGLTVSELLGHVWILGWATLQVGAFALCCSVFATTTTSAFIMTYALGTVLLVVFPFACCAGPVLTAGNFSPFGPHLAATYTFPAFFTTAVCLMLASNFLVTKAFAEPRNLLLDFFRHLDGVFHDMNRLTGGIVLVNDSVTLPGRLPVSWRETKKKSLGTVRYLFRILSAIMVPLLFTLTILSDNVQYRFRTASILLAVVWSLGAVLLCVQGTSLIAGERSRQTLEVLLTAPMSGWDILRQKLHGAWRMAGVLCVPIITIAGYEGWWESQIGGSSWPQGMGTWFYLAISLLTGPAYLTFVALFSAWLGFLFRSQARALLASVMVLAAWNAVPLWMGPAGLDLVVPAALIWQLEEKRLTAFAAGINLGLHAAAIVVAMTYLARRADAILDRAEPRFEPGVGG